MTISSGTGLSSGIDYNSLIQQLHNAGMAPITQLQNQGQTLNTQQASLQNISKALAAFKTTIDSLSDSSSFLNIAASTSDGSVLTASAAPGATQGSYGVQVQQLAQAQSLAAQGVSTADSTSISNTGGTFSFSVGAGAATTISLTAGETLQQLRDAINNSSASGVQASIINDGSPTNPFRLVLTSTNTGAANTIKFAANDTSLNFTTPTIEDAVPQAGNSFNGTITSSGTYTGTSNQNILMQVTTAGAVGTAKYKVSYDGGLTWTANDAFTTSASNVDVTGSKAQGVNVSFADAASPVNFAVGDTFSVDVQAPQLQAAQNAIVTVNGVQVTRTTNTIDNAIQGVTLTANQVSATPQSVTVASQPGNISSNIQAFATAYNSLVDAVTTETKFDTTTNTGAPLFGDSGVQNILQSVRSMINTTVPGLSSVNTLSSIGVTMGSDGHLSVDTGKLTTALNTSAKDVMKLFVQAGSSNNPSIQFVNSTSATQPGSYLVSVSQAATQASLIGGQAIGAGGLAADERLTISLGDSDAVQVNLTAGQTLASIVNQLNTSFGTNSLGLVAQDDGSGHLKISSTAFGSDQTIGVFSNQDSATANQLGFGTTQQTAGGTDVAGTINGVAAIGSGQTLSLGAGDGNGLELLVTGAAGSTASISLTQGIGLSLENYIAAETDPSNGFFANRTTSINNQIQSYNDQITTLNDRLTAQDNLLKQQFTNLETTLATLQSQGNFLMSQLNSLAASTASSSSTTK